MANHINPTVISIIVIILLGVGAGSIYLVNNTGKDTALDQTTENTTSQTNTPAQDTTTDTKPETTVTVYTDGTYTATGNYSTPGGSESITITTVISNDIVTSISASGSATSGNSKQYQSQFLSGYKNQVVGKSIEDVSLSRVAGSSLTSNGFNKALDTIKNDARA